LIVVQAVARGTARCALHVHGHGTKTNAFGRSFAVLSTPISIAGLHLRHRISAWCQADARGATQVFDYSEQAVARGAARCLLHVLFPSAKAAACGRSFAILSTQVSTAGLRLRYNRLACGIIPEVSRDAAAVGEEKLVSCAA
jgi:hypothetical protein